MQALEEKKNTMVAIQVELQAALRRAARQEALAEAAEGQLDKLKEENNKVQPLFPRQFVCCTLAHPMYPVKEYPFHVKYNYFIVDYLLTCM